MNTRKAQARGELLAQAQAALAHYPVSSAMCTFQTDSENITFRVQESRSRFLLRRHKPEQQLHHTEVGLRSEMDWLAAIRTQTDITAPHPIANIEGEWVTHGGNAFWTLTTWVEGRFLTDQHSPSRAFCAGETLARLHQHGESWVRPQRFERPRHDIQTLRKHLETYHHAAGMGLLTSDDMIVLETTGERIALAMEAVGEARSDFGLIHGDFHNRNYLFCRGRVHPIDFSLCGDGYYLADLGYALCGLWHRGVGLAGYQSIRPLSRLCLLLIETFMVFGILGETAFHIRQAQEQGRLPEPPTWLIGNLREKFLQDIRFLTNW